MPALQKRKEFPDGSIRYERTELGKPRVQHSTYTQGECLQRLRS